MKISVNYRNWFLSRLAATLTIYTNAYPLTEPLPICHPLTQLLVKPGLKTRLKGGILAWVKLNNKHYLANLNTLK